MRHFHEELEQLRQKVVQMGFVVESSVEKALEGLFSKKRQLLQEVLESEQHINQIEIEVDKMGHELLALDQPVAVDLRLVTAVLKMNTDLERIGDHAVNIAERALALLEEPTHAVLITDLETMAQKTMKMLSTALDAFRNRNPYSARDVFLQDDMVDSAKKSIFLQTERAITKTPTYARGGIQLLMICCNLERISDLACNIAEDVIYMKQGKEVRHRVGLA